MNFNYRDFFIHNDDLHIIKEQLSIIDEMPRGVSRHIEPLVPNAKDVWDMYRDMYDKGEELDEQKIADKLGINVDTVKKIIDICEKKFLESKTIKQIYDETKIATALIHDILNNTKEDWDNATSVRNTLSIFNSYSWGEYKRNHGWSIIRVIDKFNKNIKIQLLVKNYLFFSIVWCPGIEIINDTKFKAQLQKAIKETLKIFGEVTDFIKIGKSEKDVAAYVRGLVHERGFDFAWDEEHCPAVFTGPDTAGAHAGPTDKKIEAGHVINMDFGVKYKGYCADLQRTWYVLREGEDKAPAEVQRGFDIIRDSITMAAEAIKPGKQCWEIDDKGR